MLMSCHGNGRRGNNVMLSQDIDLTEPASRSQTNQM